MRENLILGVCGNRKVLDTEDPGNSQEGESGVAEPFSPRMYKACLAIELACTLS